MKNLRSLGVLKALPKVWVVVLGLVVFDTAQQPLVSELQRVLPADSISMYGVAYAQGSSKKNKDDDRKIPLMQQTTYDRLSKAQEMSEAGDHEGALEILQGMLDRARRYNNNELAQVHREIAAIYNSLDRMDLVRHHYEQILNYRKDIKKAQEEAILFVLAQLYAQEELYERALEIIHEWLALIDEPSAKPYFFVATVYFQMKDFDQAIIYVEKAIELATAAGQLPIKKGWYNMLKFLYFEKGNLPKVLEILTIMIQLYPERSTWIEMAGVFSQLGEEKKQIYAMEAAHASGLFERESDYMQFAGVLINDEAFIRAAWYLKEGIDAEMVEPSKKTWESLGNAYSASYETDKAIEALEQGLEFAEDGKMHNRLSKLYYDREEYKKCVDAVDEALEMGGLSGDDYDAKQFKGMCQFYRGNLNTAENIFIEVRREARAAEDKSAESSANSWLRYVSSERARLKDLADAEAT